VAITTPDYLVATAQAEGLLSYLGDQGVADHDLRHPLGEFQDVVPHPVRRLLVVATGASSLAESPRSGRETVRSIVARHVLARLRIDPITVDLIETVQTVERFPAGRVMPPAQSE
jgi:hypothetical protein